MPQQSSLGRAQRETLATLTEHGPLDFTLLCMILRRERRQVAALLATLERRGLVARRPDARWTAVVAASVKE